MPSEDTKILEFNQSKVFSMSTISSFKTTENNHDVYICNECMKKFWKSLREDAMEILNFKTKKYEVIYK